MTELLRCIPAELDDETDYPDLSGKKRKGRLPPAKATKSSLIVAKCREPPSKEETEKQKSVETFKIKRFQNVRPRVKCTWRTSYSWASSSRNCILVDSLVLLVRAVNVQSCVHKLVK